MLAVVRRSQKFSPRRRPLPGGVGRPKFNQLEMVTIFTYKPSLVRINARNFELSYNRPTNKQTQPQTHRQAQLQYTALQLARSVIKSVQNRIVILLNLIESFEHRSSERYPIRYSSPRELGGRYKSFVY